MSSTQNISVDGITRDNAFQVRNQLDGKVVRQYAKAMENGAVFPPIQLAQIGSGLFIVDGWHRHAAAQSLGSLEITAVVTPMSRPAALLASALANTKHGKPLKSSERRNAFRSFIRGKGHKQANGALLSYRDISEALGGHVGHTTIYGWMRKDFPRVANAMGVDTPRGKGNGEPPPIDIEAEYYNQASAAFNDSLQLFKQLNCIVRRYDIIQQIEKGLAEMKTYDHQDAGF